MFHEQPLVVLANRDEYYERPTQPAGYWEDDPNIYGGRDLVGGGTWLGVTPTGRFAAVTNFRDPTAKAGSRTRGGLVTDFLRSEMRCSEFLKAIASSAREYSPFNLLFGEFGSSTQELWYFSNRCDEPRRLSPGIYGLSNHLLDTPWPKVESGKERLTNLAGDRVLDRKRAFEILADESTADDVLLPSTGIPFAAEKALSAIFIKTPGYGTRCSSVVAVDSTGKWEFEEKVFV